MTLRYLILKLLLRKLPAHEVGIIREGEGDLAVCPESAWD